MTNIKRIFFVTKEEGQELIKQDGYIAFHLPHYELEDGKILYGHVGLGMSGSLEYWSEIGVTWRDLYPPVKKEVPEAPKTTKKRGKDS